MLSRSKAQRLPPLSPILVAKFISSLPRNPPDSAAVGTEAFEAAIEKIEEANGLSGQPRMIVFHEKEGRRHALADPCNAAIVRAIVNLGKDLGITTVAEGIETKAQADRLHQAGCNQAQGYLFSPAVAADQVPALLASRRTWNRKERRLAAISASGPTCCLRPCASARRSRAIDHRRRVAILVVWGLAIVRPFQGRALPMPHRSSQRPSSWTPQHAPQEPSSLPLQHCCRGLA